MSRKRKLRPSVEVLFSYLFTCLKGKEISAGRAVSGFKSYGRVVVQNEKNHFTVLLRFNYGEFSPATAMFSNLK